MICLDENFEDSLDFDGWNSDREMIIVPSVKNIHKELIEQALTLQINNSFSSASDYVETFNEQIESLLQEENTNSVKMRVKLCIHSLLSDIRKIVLNILQSIKNLYPFLLLLLNNNLIAKL